MTEPKTSRLFVLTPEETDRLRDYVTDCHYSGFTGINNYSRHNEVREFFYRWHLSELMKKFEKSRGAKMIFLTLTAPEVRTLHAMFQRVDCDEEVITIQRKFHKNAG